MWLIDFPTLVTCLATALFFGLMLLGVVNADLVPPSLHDLLGYAVAFSAGWQIPFGRGIGRNLQAVRVGSTD